MRGAPLHAVARGSNLRLGYVCSANRTSGSCPNASAAPAAELHQAVVKALRGTFTAESFEKYLADKAASPVEIDARHAELAHLVDVVIPGLNLRQERLLDAIEAGTITREEVKKRADKIRDERGGRGDAGRAAGLGRNAVADREQRNWPPDVLRRFLFHAAAFQGGAPLPKELIRGGVFTLPRRPDGKVDETARARLMVPAWSRSQKLTPRPIAGGSDAPDDRVHSALRFNVSRGRSVPHVRQSPRSVGSRGRSPTVSVSSRGWPSRTRVSFTRWPGLSVFTLAT